MADRICRTDNENLGTRHFAMRTADGMASRPRVSEPADIPLRDLPQLGGTTALPSGQELHPGTRSIYDSRFGDLDTGPVVPNTEVTRPGQSSAVHYLARLTKFWTTKVRCTVDFAACRDHLGMCIAFAPSNSVDLFTLAVACA